MPQQNDNAFPNVIKKTGEEVSSVGLTKREYYASRALQGMLTAKPNDTAAQLAVKSIAYADALIVELGK